MTIRISAIGTGFACLLLALLAAAASGCGADDDDEGEGEDDVLIVPAEYRTIQDAVDEADPGDLVLLSPRGL